MIAVVTQDLQVVELVTTRDVVAFQLDFADRKLVVVSAYLPQEAPNDSIHAQMELLQEIFTKNADKDLIIAGDLNAKSSV